VVHNSGSSAGLCFIVEQERGEGFWSGSIKIDVNKVYKTSDNFPSSTSITYRPMPIYEKIKYFNPIQDRLYPVSKNLGESGSDRAEKKTFGGCLPALEYISCGDVAKVV